MVMGQALCAKHSPRKKKHRTSPSLVLKRIWCATTGVHCATGGYGAVGCHAHSDASVSSTDCLQWTRLIDPSRVNQICLAVNKIHSDIAGYRQERLGEICNEDS